MKQEGLMQNAEAEWLWLYGPLSELSSPPTRREGQQQAERLAAGDALQQSLLLVDRRGKRLLAATTSDPAIRPNTIVPEMITGREQIFRNSFM